MRRCCGLNSSHFGAAAYCGLMAAEHDMIGISLTHADALMLATGGIRAFRTNPICVTAPVEGEGPFCLDMATTTITWNKVKMHRERNAPLAPGLAADGKGESTTDPHIAESLFPIGGYKGFGLGMVVDILCGLMSGMRSAARSQACIRRRSIRKDTWGNSLDRHLQVSRYEAL